MSTKNRPKSFTIFGKSNQSKLKNKINSHLLNEYIQNYNILEKQYNQLKQELSDSKTNLKISKEIIDTFMSKYSDPNSKLSLIIKSLNKKITLYHEINTKLLEDNTTLNNILSKYKLSSTRINNDLELMQTKNFILEQNIKKKDSLIKTYKNMTEIKQNLNKILISPNEANIKLNSELEYYKELSNNLIRRIKKYKEKSDFYQKQINYLQTEKEKLRMKNKEQKIKANKDKDNIILYLRKTFNNMILNDKNFKKSFNQTGDTNFNDLGYISVLNKFNKDNLSRNKGNNLESAFENFMNKTENSIYNLYEDKNITNKKIYINNEEFVDILRQVGLTEQKFFKISKNQKYSKLIDIIEFMYKVLDEKTKTINLLECENENLNQENFELNKKNMELIKSQNNNKDENDGNNSSIVTNGSKITIKNVNINTLSNYQKIFNNNMSNNSNIQDEINKIFNFPLSKTINKETENKNNINVIKFNNNESKLKNQSIKSSKKQYSFASIQSNEVEKEIGASSFLSDSTEKED